MNRLALAIPIILAALNAYAARPEIPISVDVKLNRDQPEPTLSIRLTNRSRRIVTIYRSELPWRNQHSMLLVGAALESNRLFQTLPLIDDPGPEEVAIGPDQTLEGQINLSRRFSDFRIADAGVMLFWSYQFRTIDGERSERKSGSLEVAAAIANDHQAK